MSLLVMLQTGSTDLPGHIANPHSYHFAPAYILHAPYPLNKNQYYPFQSGWCFDYMEGFFLDTEIQNKINQNQPITAQDLDNEFNQI